MQNEKLLLNILNGNRTSLFIWDLKWTLIYSIGLTECVSAPEVKYMYVTSIWASEIDCNILCSLDNVNTKTRKDKTLRLFNINACISWYICFKNGVNWHKDIFHLLLCKTAIQISSKHQLSHIFNRNLIRNYNVRNSIVDGIENLLIQQSLDNVCFPTLL